jgi:hypothetical protein
MFNQNFDPYEALINMDRNLQNIIAAHNLLAQRVEQQQQVIETLIKGLEAANKANELMLTQNLSTIIAQGQH